MRYHRFFEEFILGTPQKQYVQDVHIYICKINSTILPIVGCDVEMQRIYLPSKALKHTYDKRSSTIVECIDYLHPALSSPEKILKMTRRRISYFAKPWIIWRINLFFVQWVLLSIKTNMS
jgi:hypothetical protein